MSALDKVLAAIDVGLQDTDEPVQGQDWTYCARCQLHEPVEDGELCAGCRSFLLGDSDVDPNGLKIEIKMGCDGEVSALQPGAYWMAVVPSEDLAHPGITIFAWPSDDDERVILCEGDRITWTLTITTSAD